MPSSEASAMAMLSACSTTGGSSLRACGCRMRCGAESCKSRPGHGTTYPANPKSLEIHGNPNAVTNDIGTSSLAQGPSANSCLVEAERYEGNLPPVKVFSLPAIIER